MHIQCGWVRPIAKRENDFSCQLSVSWSVHGAVIFNNAYLLKFPDICRSWTLRCRSVCFSIAPRVSLLCEHTHSAGFRANIFNNKQKSQLSKWSLHLIAKSNSFFFHSFSACACCFRISSFYLTFQFLQYPSQHCCVLAFFILVFLLFFFFISSYTLFTTLYIQFMLRWASFSISVSFKVIVYFSTTIRISEHYTVQTFNLDSHKRFRREFFEKKKQKNLKWAFWVFQAVQRLWLHGMRARSIPLI